MSENRQDLPSKLAKAHQQLKKAQTRVADLEAQLFEGQPNSASLLASEERYKQRLEILHQIDIGIINATSIQEVVESALKHIRQIIPCQRADVMILDDITGEALIFAMGFDSDTTLGQGVHVPSPPTGFEGYDARHIRVFDDFRPLQDTMPRTRRLVNEGLLCALSALLMDRERPIGVLGLFADTPGFFTAEHQEIAAEIASQLTIAIHQMRLDEALTRHAAELEQRVVERTADLNDAKQRVEAILNNVSDGILLVHTDMSIQQTNSSFNSLFACDPDDYFGKSLVTLVHAEDAGKVTAILQTVAAEQQGKSIEIRTLRKDGTVFDAELSLGFIKHDGLVCTVRDITERKAQERQLRYYASLQESVVDAVIVTDTAFHIQTWNLGAERIYGWASDEVIGKSAPELLQIRHPSTQDRRSARQQFNEQRFLQQETIQRHKDGSDIFILGSATLLADENGVPVGVISVNRDITERKAQERQLRYQATLQQNVSDAVIVTDPEFRIQSWNKAAERIYGWSAEEVVNKATATILRNEFSSPSDNEQSRQQLREQGWWQGEVIQHHKDGSVRHILGSVTLIKDENGIPFSVVSVNHDVSEQKQAEVVLRESEARYRLLAENVTDVIVQTKPDGTRTFVSPSCYALLGYTPEELVGVTGVDIVHPDDIAKTNASVMQAIESSKPAFSITQRVRHKAGHYVWVEATNSIIRHPDTGSVIGFIGVFRDIAERKKAELKLHEAEHRYHALFEQSHDAVFLVDMQGNYLEINHRAGEMLGYSVEELRTLTFRELSDDVPQSEETIKYLRAGETVPMFERVMRKKGGNRISVEISTEVVRDLNGNPLHIQTIVRDITERKHAEEAIKAKMEEEREFQNYLKELHEITIELTQIDELDIFYKRVVEFGLERLRFERLAMFLYDEKDGAALGTYGTDSQGEIVDERHIRFTPDPNAIMLRAFNRAERFYFDEHVSLFNDMEAVGFGWNAATVLWNGTESLGWLVADNLLHQTPASKSQLDILGLYGLTVGTLLAQKRTQLALSDREERFRQYFELPLIGMALTSPDKGWIQVNDKLCEMLGYSREELVQMTWAEITYPDDLAPDIEQFEQVLAGKLDGYSIDKRFIRKDGRLIFMTITIRAVRHPDGRFNYFVGLMQDISERKQAEEALRDSEARYRLLADTINDVVIRFSPKLEYLYLSPSSRTVLGYEPQELLGPADFGHIHPEDVPAIQGLIKRLTEHPGGATIAYRFLHKEGHYIWLESAGQAVISKQTGEVVEFVFSARDVTERKAAEEALRESEEKFRLLMDAAPIAIIITNESGQITLLNNQAETVFGYHRGELVGQSVDTLLPDAARDRHADNRANYLAAPRVRRMGLGLELCARRKDASEFPVEIELSYIETQAGLLVMSFVVDITERKRVAAELERQRTFLRNVIDASPSMIFVKDYDARFVLVNRLVAQMYNTTVDALLGKSDADFNPSMKENADFLEADRRVIASGEPLFLEEPVTNFAGETHWLQTTKVPIVSADGKSKFVLGVSTDITERKQAERALREQHEFLQLVINNVPGLITVKDRLGQIELVNKGEADLYGVTPEDMLGKMNADFNPNQAEVDYFLQKDHEALETGQSIFIPEETVLGRYYQTSKIPLKNRDGEYNRLLVVASDITERKNAEETLRQAFEKEKELGELKSRFVSMASHEFRTPLATILALTETLMAYRHKLRDEEIEQRLVKIQDQVGHLKDIMDDVLLLARMQARRVDFNPVKINLDSLCRSVMDEFQSRPDVTHQFVYSCDERLHEIVLDKKLMRQMINNLVSNAVKYSKADSSIMISLEFENDTLIFKVADQGIGIPEADLKHLFEPFHRAENVGTISGTGLGTVITKEAVEMHNGTITVESQVGIGTTVIVSIPLTK